MSSRRIRCGLLSIAAGVAALVTAGRADAYERQWHLGASLGYAGLVGSATGNGFGGDGHLAYGLTDSFDFAASAGLTAFPGAKVLVPTAGAGVDFVILDTFQWIPRVGLLLGPGDVLSTDGTCGSTAAVAPCHRFKLNVEVPLAVDYQINRSVAVGVAGRYQLLLFSGLANNVVSVFARAEYTWGY